MKLRNMTCLFLFKGHQLLMLYRIGSRIIAPSWCGIGGHFEENELNDPLKCVLREAREEIGLTLSDMRDIALRYVTLAHRANELRQNYYFFAQLSNPDFTPINCPEGLLKWMDMGEIEGLEMPLTAKQALLHYLKKGKNDAALYVGVAHPNKPILFQVAEEF